MNLTNPSVIAAVCDEFNFKLKKKFGQNFLINPEIPKKIATSSKSESSLSACIEIGPGIGSLTYELAKIHDKVTAFEIDSGLLPVLEKTLSEFDNITVINEDILKIDLKEFIEENFAGYSVTVCANLPYYITTPIVMKILESSAKIEKIVVMMQKEVAQRLTAKAGSAQYGAITPQAEYYAQISRLFDVSPGNFMPRPDVTSTVVQFKPHKEKTVSPVSPEFLSRTIRGAFALRRKTLLNSLSSEFGTLSKDELTECIESAHLDISVRGEALTLKQLSDLSDEIYKKLS